MYIRIYIYTCTYIYMYIRIYILLSCICIYLSICSIHIQFFIAFNHFWDNELVFLWTFNGFVEGSIDRKSWCLMCLAGKNGGTVNL